MFRYARVLLASCRVHTLTLNNAKKSHTVMQRSERWEQVKWTKCSKSTCFFFKRDSRVWSSVGWINQIFAMSFYASFCFALLRASFALFSVFCSAIRGTVTLTYSRILFFVRKQAERFQWEWICKRGGGGIFFFYLRRRSPQGDGWRTRNGAKTPNTRGLSVIKWK